MKQHYPFSHYNRDFAVAVMNAHLKSKKTFIFNKMRYTTCNYVANVIDDIQNGHYTIKAV